MGKENRTRFFFIHIMKTGGTSFVDILRYNFNGAERYPDVCLTPDSDLFESMEAYMHVPAIVKSVNSRAKQLRIVRGHVPYSVESLFDGEFETLTLLRNPVERTISYLKHCRRYHVEHMSLSLEEIYDDIWFRKSFMENYQTKIFSMTSEEALSEERFPDRSPPLPPRCEMIKGKELPDYVKKLRDQGGGRFTLECYAPSTAIIEVDNYRLQVARENLGKVGVVGVTERYEAFLTRLAGQYGWNIRTITRRNVGEDDTVPSSLRQQIARDNAFDLELYEYAKSISA